MSSCYVVLIRIMHAIRCEIQVSQVRHAGELMWFIDAVSENLIADIKVSVTHFVTITSWVVPHPIFIDSTSSMSAPMPEPTANNSRSAVDRHEPIPWQFDPSSQTFSHVIYWPGSKEKKSGWSDILGDWYSDQEGIERPTQRRRARVTSWRGHGVTGPTWPVQRPWSVPNKDSHHPVLEHYCSEFSAVTIWLLECL